WVRHITSVALFGDRRSFDGPLRTDGRIPAHERHRATGKQTLKPESANRFTYHVLELARLRQIRPVAQSFFSRAMRWRRADCSKSRRASSSIRVHTVYIRTAFRAFLADHASIIFNNLCVFNRPAQFAPSILYLFYIVIISYYRDLNDRTRRLYDFLMQPMQL